MSKKLTKTEIEHPNRLTVEERRELEPSDFGIPETREFPMPDALHVRSAESYFRYADKDKKPRLARNILKKAEEFGVDVESKTILEWAAKK